MHAARLPCAQLRSALVARPAALGVPVLCRSAATAAAAQAAQPPPPQAKPRAGAAAAATAAPSASAAEAFTELKRRTKLTTNYGRVAPKHVHNVLRAVRSGDKEAALANAAVTVARGHANLAKDGSSMTGDMLVRALLRAQEDKAAALGRAIDAIRHPHSGMTLSPAGAGALVTVAGEVGDADQLKRALALVKERGVAPGPMLVVAAIEAALKLKQPRQAVKLYLWRLSYRKGVPDNRCLFRLAKGLLAMPDPSVPFRTKDDKGVPGKEYSEDGKKLVAHVEAALAAPATAASAAAPAAGASAPAAVDKKEGKGQREEKVATGNLSPATKAMLGELVEKVKAGKVAAASAPAAAPAAAAAEGGKDKAAPAAPAAGSAPKAEPAKPKA